MISNYLCFYLCFYDFDYCLGSFPNDFKVVIFVLLDFYERNLFGFTRVFNEECGKRGGFY